MKRIYLHALPVRIWHWVNAVSFLALIATGIQIRYRAAIKLTSFKTAVDVHNFIGFVLILNFCLWAVYYLLSGKLKVYLPDPNLKNFLRGSIRQARNYAYGIFIGEQNPHHATPDSKFNPMQQVAYFNIMLLFMPLQIATGLMLWDIKLFSGGYSLCRRVQGGGHGPFVPVHVLYGLPVRAHLPCDPRSYMRGISCHLPVGFGAGKVASCADARAQAMDWYLGYKLQSGGAVTDTGYLNSLPKNFTMSHEVLKRGACPDCGSAVEHADGCLVCRGCGYSECG